MFNKKGQMGGNPIVNFILVIIMLVGVAIPITQSVVDNTSVTGIALTILGFMTTFLAVAGLALAAKMSS